MQLVVRNVALLHKQIKGNPVLTYIYFAIAISFVLSFWANVFKSNKYTNIWYGISLTFFVLYSPWIIHSFATDVGETFQEVGSILNQIIARISRV